MARELDEKAKKADEEAEEMAKQAKKAKGKDKTSLLAKAKEKKEEAASTRQEKAEDLLQAQKDAAANKKKKEEDAKANEEKKAIAKANQVKTEVLTKYQSIYMPYKGSFIDMTTKMKGVGNGEASCSLMLVDAPWRPLLSDWTGQDRKDLRDCFDWFLEEGGTAIIFDRHDNLHLWTDVLTPKLAINHSSSKKIRNVLHSKYKVCSPFVTGFKPPTEYKRLEAAVFSRTEHWIVVKRGVQGVDKNNKSCFHYSPGIKNRDGHLKLYGETRPQGEDWQDSGWLNIPVPSRKERLYHQVLQKDGSYRKEPLLQCQKSPLLLSWLISMHTVFGDRICVLTGGTMRSVVAAIQLGRKVIVAELDPVMYQVAHDDVLRTLKVGDDLGASPTTIGFKNLGILGLPGTNCLGRVVPDNNYPPAWPVDLDELARRCGLEIFDHLEEDVVTGETKDLGRGVRTTRDIKKGEAVCYFMGDFVTPAERVARKSTALKPKEYMKLSYAMKGYLIEIAANLPANLINDPRGCKGRYPNALFRQNHRLPADGNFTEALPVIALCDLPAGTPVFSDYGSDCLL